MFLVDDDIVLRTVAFGPGPETVLALNGWSANWECWQPTFEVLSRTTRCLSYDTRGTGNSSAPAHTVGLTALVDDVFRVLDAHEVDTAVLAGESLGGFVALHAVLRDPTRFKGLATVCAPAKVEPGTTAALSAGARADYLATIEFFAQLCLAPEAGSAHLGRWGAWLFRDADPEVAARLFEVCHGHEPDLSQIRIPTVVIHGEGDAVVPVAVGREMAATIPGARYVELAGACHAPTVTRPTEVAAAIRSLF